MSALCFLCFASLIVAQLAQLGHASNSPVPKVHEVAVAFENEKAERQQQGFLRRVLSLDEQHGGSDGNAVAAEVLLQVVCTVSNRTSCSSTAERLEMIFKDVFVGVLGVPSDYLAITATCVREEGDAARPQASESASTVLVEVAVAIPADVPQNISAYNRSAVADLIGNGTNQSKVEDYVNPSVQIVTLNVVASAASLYPAELDSLLQEELEAEQGLEEVLVEAVSEPTVVLKTTTSSTSSSTSSSSTTTTARAAPASDDSSQSVISFTVFLAVRSNSSHSGSEAVEAFSNATEVVEALRHEYAASVSVEPSAVVVTIIVLPPTPIVTPDSGRRRLAATPDPNVQVNFRVTVPSDASQRVESSTRSLAASGFQGLVNTAVAAVDGTPLAADVVRVSDVEVRTFTSTSTTSSWTSSSSAQSSMSVTSAPPADAGPTNSASTTMSGIIRQVESSRAASRLKGHFMLLHLLMMVFTRPWCS